MRVQDPKCQIEAKPTWHHFGDKINWFRAKKILKINKTLKGELMIWRTKMQARVQGGVQTTLKDSICFK
jgi:hypothetical protein